MASHLHTVAPTVAVTLGSGLNWGASNVRVESIHWACGVTPGMAVLSLPSFRIDAATVKTSNIIGRVVTIDMHGSRAFAGRVYSVRQSWTDDDESVEVVLLDGRADAAVLAIGDPGNSDYTTIGWDVTFNRDGKPDRSASDQEFARGDPTAVYWTIGDILSYVGEKYVDGMLYSYLDWADSEFSGFAGWNIYPGEVRLAGMSVADALDYLIGMLGDVTWAINYTTNRIYAVSTSSVGTSRTIVIPRTTNTTVSYWTASRGDYVRDARRSLNRVIVIGGKTVVETTYETAYSTGGSGNGLLVEDTSFAGGDVYSKRFRVDPTKYVNNYLGASLASNAAGKPWVPELVTHRALSGASYLTAAQYCAAPQSSQPCSERECLWIKEGDEGTTWLRVTSGYEVQYDPPALYFEPSLVCLDANGAEQSVDVATTDLEIRFTVATEIEEQPYGYYDGTTVEGFAADRTRYVERPDAVRRRRYNARLPTLGGSDPTASSVVAEAVEDYWPTTDHAYSHDDLTDIAEKYADSLVELQRECTIVLEWIPTALNLGDCLMLRSESGYAVLEAASGFYPDEDDVAMVVSVDFELGSDAFRTTIHASNQLGATQLTLGPSATSTLLEYRNMQALHRRIGGRGVEEMIPPAERTRMGRLERLVDRWKERADSLARKFGDQHPGVAQAKAMAQRGEAQILRLGGK